MKKLVIGILIAMLSLCGCDKEPEKINNNTETVPETTSQISGGHNVDPNMGIMVYQKLYKVKKEENGDIKCGSFIEDNINYDGNKIELAIDMSVTSGKDLSGMMEAMVLMVVDKQLIPFSVEGSKEAIIHKVELENTVTARKFISFSVDSINTGEEKEWAVLLVPLLEEYAHVPDEVVVGVCDRNLVSSVAGTDAEMELCDKGYFYDAVENLYGKSLFEICQYNGVVKDFILQGEDGKWYYTLDSRSTDTLVVMLFCDGELYNGFDGKSNLYIDKTVEQQQLHKEIDTSMLTAGKHEMMAIILEYDDEGNISGARKSLVGNIDIVK